MKPFNLEAALQGKLVVTRDGRKVKIAGYNPDAGKEEQLVGWVDNRSREWSADGLYVLDGNRAYDLFMAAEEVTVWVNVYYEDGKIVPGGMLYDTEESAIEGSSDINGKYLGAYPLTIKR